MLTISQAAGYAGVTVRAVRHYHNIGLLPEPERDRSGYRSYDAAAVVRLIRIRVLAAAGVPLARVAELLDADPDRFEDAIAQIDAQLRGQIRHLRQTRTRIGQLAAGEQLALPQTVVDYLDRLRGIGVVERYIAMERDAWIMLAAQVPDAISDVIAAKQAQLDDPDMVALYRLLSRGIDWAADDPGVVELADLLERLILRYLPSEPNGTSGLDDQFVNLLDTVTRESAPAAKRLMEILHERGWRGWTRIEKLAAPEA